MQSISPVVGISVEVAIGVSTGGSVGAPSVGVGITGSVVSSAGGGVSGGVVSWGPQAATNKLAMTRIVNILLNLNITSSSNLKFEHTSSEKIEAL
jgi:hypothetical protein